MARLSLTNISRPLVRPVVVIAVLVVLVFGVVPLLGAQGNQLLNRSLKLSNNAASQTSNYVLSFKPQSLDTIEYIRLQLCSNDPFPGTPCTPPVGLDASSATLTNQSGDGGFSISGLSTSNVIVLARSPFASNGVQDTYTLSGIKNPANNGSYFARVETFADGDLNNANNYGGIAIMITNGISVSAVVPPYITFCAAVQINGFDCNDVTGDYVNLGELSSRQASLGTSQLLAATNADHGYTVAVGGVTLTSGTNVIPALAGNDTSRPGVSQFGINLRANSSPQGGQDPLGRGTGQPMNGYGQPNLYRFSAGDIIAASTGPDYARKYTVSYLVNVNKSQAPGVYVSTVQYVALGNF